MLYTIVDWADIFYDQPALPELKCENGRYLEGSNTQNGFCVSRLISTDPKDYLNEAYNPGSLLGKNPVK